MGAVARRRLHRLGGGPVGRPGWVIRQGAYCVAIRGTAKGSPGNKRITVRQKYESPPHVMRSRWSGYFPASPKPDEPEPIGLVYATWLNLSSDGGRYEPVSDGTLRRPDRRCAVLLRPCGDH